MNQIKKSSLRKIQSVGNLVSRKIFKIEEEGIIIFNDV